jgi:tRNA (cytidine56-2'-O)-methyltransferase
MILVLRLGHRPGRDKRITTHVGLVARAFGADEFILASPDSMDSLKDVISRWGGNFSVRVGANWREEIKRWKAAGRKVCHLTMHGKNLPDCIHEIRKEKDIMIVVGAEKVPPEVYRMADWNIAIGKQPHSEVSALAVFLDWYFQGRELE